MSSVGGKDGNYHYEGEMRCDVSGLVGYMIRIMPQHPDVRSPNELLYLSPGLEG